MINVIIPAYNAESTIRRCVESVQKQNVITTVIVVDDCSTDNTVSICRELHADYVLTSTANSGSPNAGRNRGLEIDNGAAHFCFLDHDDELVPNALENLLNMNVDIAFGLTLKNRKPKAETGKIVYYKDNELFLGFLSQEHKKFPLPYLSGMLFKKELSIFKFEMNYGAMIGIDYILKVSEHKTAGFIDKYIVSKNWHDHNLSKNEKYRIPAYWINSYLMLNYYKHYPEETLKGIQKLAGTLARYYFSQGDMKLARFYFKHSKSSLKKLSYLLASYIK
jgi:glycosyltransferase involved in cell wall biosynthesis